MSPTIVKNSISVTGTAEQTVTTTMLQAASTGIADNKLLFTIDTLPSQGGLKLNGTALALKGTFTQADINAGKLTYLPSGTTATMDGFGFTVTDGTTTTATPGSTQRVSISSSGTQGDNISGTDFISTINLLKNSISADGRYVAYESLASNLAAGDASGKYDIFVYDRQTGSNQRVSVSSSGSEGNGDSIHPAISADGRYVTFQSQSSNLVTGDTNTNGAQTNVFVRDLQTGTTELVSVNSSGVQSILGGANPVISADGRYVAFFSFSGNLIPGGGSFTSGNLFIRDRQTGTTKLVSADSSGNPANDVSGGDSVVSISADGRYVAFDARASNLVAGDTNNFRDVFVRDVQTGTTQRVSVDNSGNQLDRASNNPVISADGKSVAFYALSTNTAQTTIFVRDLVAGTTTAVASGALLQQGAGLATSADGRFIAYVDGSSGSFALKLYDRQSKVTDEVANAPYSSAPSLAGFSISANGQFVAFSSGSPLVASDTNNFADVFVRDRGSSGGAISSISATAAITIAPKVVPQPNNAPIVANPIATQSIVSGSALNFIFAANTFTDPDSGDVLTYSAKLANGNNLPTWLTFNAVTRTFAGTPAAGDVGNLSIAVTATDKAGLTVASNFGLNITGAVLPSNSPISGITVTKNLFQTDATTKGFGLSALTQKSTNKVNEIGLFAVDDLTGKIGAFAPDSAGYLKAVLDIAQPIFTTLAGTFLNQSKQEFSIDPNKIYQFFEIQDGSIVDLKQQLANGKTPTNILYSLPGVNGISPIQVTTNSNNNGYKISVNADELVLDVVKLAGASVNNPIGTKSQTAPEGRTIDFTDYVGKTLKVDISTKSDAAYDDNIGFYTVEDAIGSIKLANGSILKPGDTNYAVEAIKNALTNSQLLAGKTDSKLDRLITGGKIYAPVVVAQGTLNDFVSKNQTNGGDGNAIHAYFNYLGANPDKLDHFRLIGNNTFGVEDLYGGGDRDFNDLVVNFNVKSVA